MTNLLALWQTHYSAWAWSDWLVMVIIIAACVGVVIVALRVFQVSIPEWAVQIFWIVVVAFVAIFAIRLLSSM